MTGTIEWGVGDPPSGEDCWFVLQDQLGDFHIGIWSEFENEFVGGGYSFPTSYRFVKWARLI